VRALLDVNVLLALLDSQHVHHERARAWLTSQIEHGWSSCAITQNGFIRVSSISGYPNRLSPMSAGSLLRSACDTDRHEQWHCSISLLDPANADLGRVTGARQITDVYLLALAVAHGGRLVTFDRSIPMAAVPSAREDHLVVL
jgi:toxin-antitoxin system PIN domain toxin